MTGRVVMMSGGIGSWATAKRVAAEHGTDELTLLFADVRGDSVDPHVGEDLDSYRFLADAAENIGVPITRVADGRTIWDVFKDRRFLGNARQANCSTTLKQIPCRRWLEARYPDPADAVVYIGIDWSESHRVASIARAYLPYRAECPMTDPPYLDKAEMIAWAERDGLKPPALYERSYSHNNCFHPDTSFITDNGIKTFRETLGKTVRVLGKSAGWTDATVESFGEQPTVELMLRRFDDEKRVITTADHRWPVRRQPGRTAFVLRATADLVLGQRIAGMYGHVRHNVRPAAIGVAAGFTFGDGMATEPTNGQITPAMAFFCGDKDLSLLSYFASCRMSVRADGVTVAHDLPRAWKQPPPLDESQSYLYGWLSGYFAADGTFAKGSARIATARAENAVLVRDVAARLGIAANPTRVEYRKGYGAVPTPLYTVTFTLSTLRADFFIIPAHLERFQADRQRLRPADWQVVSVETTGRIEEVMCAVVPDGHMFTLDDNLHTSNCGGGCVRAGHGAFTHLLADNPERFAVWERNEADLRTFLDKDVAILRDRTGGHSRPMPLTELRSRVERGGEVDRDDVGGCGCFTEIATE